MCYAGVPYDLTPNFLDELLTKHRIDYVIHGDDPCIMPGARSHLHRCILLHLLMHHPLGLFTLPRMDFHYCIEVTDHPFKETV